MKHNFLLIVVAASVLAFTATLSSCKKDENPPSNESEVISKVTVTLVDSTSGNRYMFAYEDPDGDGGRPPVIDTILVQAGRTYAASLRLFDITLDSTIELTQEIVDEADEHQLFYAPSAAGLTVKYDETDKDVNGIYIGLKTRWYTQALGKGSIKIVLKHQPDVKSSGPKPFGDQTKGDTDVEITFPYRIE